MKKWIVYRHTSPSGKVYIGISSNIKSRWAHNGYNYSRYNSIFKNAVNKYGWDNITHEILLDNCSKEEAIYAEKYLIRWYKIHGLSYNITDGGEGREGVKCSRETIEKIRNSNKGQKRTPEQIENLRKAHFTEKAMMSSKKNICYAHTAWKGRHHSDETKKKMSEAAKGRDMRKAIEASLKVPHKKTVKAVLQLDLSNNVINSFSSITEANNSLGKTSKAIVNCLQGRTKTAFGYRWEYIN